MVEQDGGHVRVLAFLVARPATQHRVWICIGVVRIEGGGSGEGRLDGGFEVALLADDGADKDIVVFEKGVRGCGPTGFGEELGCEVSVLVGVAHRRDGRRG